MSETDPLIRLNPPSSPMGSQEILDISEQIRQQLRIRAKNASLLQWFMDFVLLVICAGYYIAVISTVSCTKYPEVCSKVEGPADVLLDSGILNTMPEDSWIIDLNITTQIPSPNEQNRSKHVTNLYMAFGVSMLVKTFFWVSNLHFMIHIIEDSDEGAKRIRGAMKFFTVGRVANGFLDTLVLIGGFLLLESNESMAVGVFAIMIYPLIQLFYVIGSLHVLIEINVSLKEAECVDEIIDGERDGAEFEMTVVEMGVVEMEAMV